MSHLSKWLFLALVSSAVRASDLGLDLDGSVAGSNQLQLGPLSVAGSFGASKSLDVGHPDPDTPEILPTIITFGKPTPAPPTAPTMRPAPPPPPPTMRIPPPPPPPTPCNNGQPHYRSLENVTGSTNATNSDMKNSTQNATVEHDKDHGHLHFRSLQNATNSELQNNSTKNATVTVQDKENHGHVNFRSLQNSTNSELKNNSTQNATVRVQEKEHHGHINFRSLQNATDSELQKNSTQNATEAGLEKRPLNPKFKGLYEKLRAIFK